MSKSLAASVVFLTSIFIGPAHVYAEQKPIQTSEKVASHDFPACFDHNGTPARYLPNDIGLDNPWVMYFGVRYMDRQNIEDPVIFYDPDLMDTLPKAAIDFTIAHECHHLTSGDTHRAYLAMNDGNRPTRKEMLEQEDTADCVAAQRLRDEFQYTRQEVKDAVTAISQQINFVDLRISKIMSCYDTPHQKAAFN